MVDACASRISGSRSVPSTVTAGDPAQVIEAHVVQHHALRLDAQVLREVALEADGHVAQPQGAMPLVQERLRHDADRVGEVHDPGVGRRPLADQLGQLHHHRHRAQRLGEATGAGRLLADGVELERERLVGESGLLPADSQLDQHEVRVVDRGGGVIGQGQATRPFDPMQHPLREPAHDLQPVQVDVVEHELLDWQAVATVGEPFDQLGCVGAAAADDGDLDAQSSPRGRKSIDDAATHCL